MSKPNQIPQKPNREIMSISELNRQVKTLIEDGFPPLWVEAELSNLSQPSSGHLYFTLKDEKAQVRCAMFRGRNRFLQFKPSAGERVLARVQVSLYENRGDFQLIVDRMEPAGEGALRQAFEQLKQHWGIRGDRVNAIVAEEARKAFDAMLERRVRDGLQGQFGQIEMANMDQTCDNPRKRLGLRGPQSLCGQ